MPDTVVVSTRGRALIGTTPVGVLPGSRLDNPNPPFFPGGVDGNAYQSNFLRQLREPRATLIAVA